MGAGFSTGKDGGPLSELKFSWPLRYADSVRSARRAPGARQMAASCRRCSAARPRRRCRPLPPAALRPAPARSLHLRPHTQPVKYASSSSLAVIKRGDGSKWLALAYQAAAVPYEGSRGQHICFALSKDGGETFSPSRPVMWGVGPLWSPSLHHDAGARRAAAGPGTAAAPPDSVGAAVGGGPGRRDAARLPHRRRPCTHPPATNRLFLFYSESRKALSPGGDIKVVTSADYGETWGAPQLLYAHEAEGEVPKVCGHRLLVAKDGTWYLPGALAGCGAPGGWLWRPSWSCCSGRG